MTTCVRWGAMDRNLVREVRRNVEEPRDRYVTDEEVDAFLQVAPPLVASYTRLKIITGARQHQLLALRLSDWNGKVLTIKGRSGVAQTNGAAKG